MSVTYPTQSLPADAPQTRADQSVSIDAGRLRWWMVTLLILVLMGILRFTGYNYTLPYRATGEVDERDLFAQALIWRGVGFTSGVSSIEAGYPPGAEVVDTISLIITEQWFHRVPLDVTAEALAVSRGIGTAFGLLTGLILGMLSRRLAGNVAGWLTMLGWLLLWEPIYQAAEARAEPGLMLFMALTLYLTIIAFESPWPGWLVLAVVAALVDCLFKYSAYPLMAAAAIPTIIYVLKRRRKWGLVLLFEGLALAGSAFIVFVANPIQSGLGRNEGRIVLGSGMSRIFDIKNGLAIVAHAINQVGITPLIMVILSVVGTVLFWQRSQKQPGRRLGWLTLLGIGYMMAWSPIIYYFEYPSLAITLSRYTISATVALVPMAAISAVLLADWIGKRFKSKTVIRLALTGFALIWLFPQAQQSLAYVQGRAKPDTRSEIMQWSLTNLGPGTVLVFPEILWIYSKEWGGWDGLYRVFLNEPIITHSLDYYRQEVVNYAVIGDEDLAKYQKSTAFATNYLTQMLLLNHFPPDNQANVVWQGPPMGIYRLWRMQHETAIHFADNITLTGYDLNVTRPQPGDSVKLTLYWQAGHTPTDNYNVFIHLYPENEFKLLAQTDGSPAGLQRPTLSWKDSSETLISPEFTLQLPTNLESGCYRLVVGLYNYQTGKRLNVGTQDYMVLDRLCVGLQEF